jgi:gag-polypeptide of LTR copia-type/Domain of unknown function (DUF4219)
MPATHLSPPQGGDASSPPQGGNAPSAGAVTSSASTSKGTKHYYDIENLEEDGTNFVFWKYRVQIVLEIQDLWPIVDGTYPKPADPTATAKWSCKDREARAQITLTLKNEPLNSVLVATSAKDCWEKLLARYEGKGEQRIIHLIDKVFRSTLSNTEPLEP